MTYVYARLGDQMSAITERLAARLLTLRKQKGWSQPVLGKQVGTSGAIIGRYERGEMTPSVDVASKLADALDVTLDSLISDKDMPSSLKDKSMLERWQTLDQLNLDERERIISVMDSLLRDAQARQTYRISA